ncbi:MAG: TspO/MBR family protein [Acidobacteriota bacterium]
MQYIYMTLKKPFFAPPGWVFGPVWTVLYIMMAYSAFRIYRVGWEKSEVKYALILFGTQLFFNVIWTPLFFNLQLRGVALIDIILILGFLVLTIIQFAKLDKIAAYLLIPYLLWVCFATVLNASFWYLNR